MLILDCQQTPGNCHWQADWQVITHLCCSTASSNPGSGMIWCWTLSVMVGIVSKCYKTNKYIQNMYWRHHILCLFIDVYHIYCHTTATQPRAGIDSEIADKWLKRALLLWLSRNCCTVHTITINNFYSCSYRKIIYWATDYMYTCACNSPFYDQHTKR